MIENRFSTIRKYVVVITTGRSGSSFVSDLVNRNALNASSEHEPDLVPVDVSTQWYYDGAGDRLAELVDRKIARLRRGEMICAIPFADRVYTRFARSRTKRMIPRVPIREVYVEVDNGFLKSCGHQMLDMIPDIEIIHLTRNPLLQAKSAENRKTQPNPNRPYYLWPTWERNVFRLSENVTAGLSDFQLALWYWFEMEARYVDVLDRHDVRPPVDICIDDLNVPGNVEDLFTHIGVKHHPLDLQVNRNSGPRKSLIRDRDRREARTFLELVPDHLMQRLPNTYGIENL